MSVKSEEPASVEQDAETTIKEEMQALQHQEEDDEPQSELVIDTGEASAYPHDEEVECPLLKKYLGIARQWPRLVEYSVTMGINHNGPFIKIENTSPDRYLLYRSNLMLVVRSGGSDLFCTLYTYRHHVFKGMVIKDFDKFVIDEATRQGVQLFLRELERDKYRVCSGAFTEEELTTNLNSAVLKSMFIERLEGSIVYRSRDCYSLVMSVSGDMGGNSGTTVCRSCLRLKMDLVTVLFPSTRSGSKDSASVEIAEVLGGGEESADSLANLVEVCIHADEEDEEVEDEESKISRKSREEQEDDDRNFGEVYVSLDPTNRSRGMTSVPRVSYKNLIISAIMSSPDKMMKLTDIYDWILLRHPSFKSNKTSFQNSIRHNLSLNRIFTKVAPELSPWSVNIGKGSYWAIDANEVKSDEDLQLGLGVKSGLNKSAHVTSDMSFKIRLPPKDSTNSPKIMSRSAPVKILPKPSSTGTDSLSNSHQGVTSTNSSESCDSIRTAAAAAVAVDPQLRISSAQGQPVILTQSESSAKISSVITHSRSLLKPVLSAGSNSSAVLDSGGGGGGNNVLASNASAATDSVSDSSSQQAGDKDSTSSVPISDSTIIKDLPTNIKEQLKTGLPIILRPLDNPGPTAAISIVVKPACSTSPLTATTPPPTPSAAAPPPAEKVIGGSAVTLTQRDGPLTAVTTASPSRMRPIEHIERSQEHQQFMRQLQQKLANQMKTPGVTTLSTKEFPKPPFSYKELCMIAIFYSPDVEMSLSQIYEHIKLWFPYYRQPSIGMTWQNSIRHNLSLNKCFIRIERMNKDDGKSGKWTFDPADDCWKKLVVSNKWFETPVDAELFEHMAKHCQEFQQKVYSKKSMFRTVPVSVKTTKATSNPTSPPAVSGILTADNAAGFLHQNNDIHSEITMSGLELLSGEEPLSPAESPPPSKKLKTEPSDMLVLKEEVLADEDCDMDPLG